MNDEQKYLFDLNGYLVLEQVVFNSLGGALETRAIGVSALVAPPVDLFNTPKGKISFDFDLGSAELPHLGLVSAGEDVSVEISINEVTDLINYGIKVVYDPTKLSYVTYVANNFLAGNGGLAISLAPLVDIPETGSASLEIGASILGSKAGQGMTGSFLIGTLTFTATAAFSETDIFITELSSKSFGGTQVTEELSIFSRVSTESLAGAAFVPTPDFNGNGTVDILDFFLFADAFGGTDTIFDLNENGAVDILDFFMFADAFGSTVGKLSAAGDLPKKAGLLYLESASNGDGVELTLQAAEMYLTGYDLALEYDPAAFRFVGATDVESAMGEDGRSLLLSGEDGPGRMRIAASRVGDAAAVQGLLARLQFEPLQPEAEGLFRISPAAVRRHDGLVMQPRQLGGGVTARWLPNVFDLRANYPNPFNPSTTIGYSLPADVKVRLDIFDVLGQKVRTLVREEQPAGFHLAVWDSRNDAGNRVAAGVYFYKLEVRGGDGAATEFSEVRKLMLVK